MDHRFALILLVAPLPLSFYTTTIEFEEALEHALEFRIRGDDVGPFPVRRYELDSRDERQGDRGEAVWKRCQHTGFGKVDHVKHRFDAAAQQAALPDPLLSLVSLRLALP